MGKELQLESALGRQIPNEQLQELSAVEINLFGEIERTFGAGIKERAALTPRYNCHGFAFAGRRTGIFDAVVVRQILHEDGYEEVPLGRALPGDVLVYFDQMGDAEHSAVVVETAGPELLNIPMVLSKWGKYKELYHRANHCPYSFADVRYYRITNG